MPTPTCPDPFTKNSEEPEPTFDIPPSTDSASEEGVENEEVELVAVTVEDGSDELDELSDMIRESSQEEEPEPATPEAFDSMDDIRVIGADIVNGREKMKKKKVKVKDPEQLPLFEDYESIQASGNATKESGTTGV